MGKLKGPASERSKAGGGSGGGRMDTAARRRSGMLTTRRFQTTHAFVSAAAQVTHAHPLLRVQAAHRLLEGQLNASGQDAVDMAMKAIQESRYRTSRRRSW